MALMRTPLQRPRQAEAYRTFKHSEHESAGVSPADNTQQRDSENSQPRLVNMQARRLRSHELQRLFTHHSDLVINFLHAFRSSHHLLDLTLQTFGLHGAK
jgi:DNA-binding SARP family transcriptional activator